MTTKARTAVLSAADNALIDYLRQHAELSQGSHDVPQSWRYESVFHLLLALGRTFTHTPRPDGQTSMPAGHCYTNAARYAWDHRDEGMVYAEGFAQTHPGLGVYLPHAWTVRADETALDPTWDDTAGRAYLGIPVADCRMWPVDGGGLLQDFDRALPLLRDGFPSEALAQYGLPLMTDKAAW